MTNSSDTFDFLNDVWGQLPDSDRLAFGELWKGYEQSYGAIWTQLLERKFAVNINNVPLYNNKRWLQHAFSTGTQYNRVATYQSNQDLSTGINLSLRYLIKFSVDGGAPIEVDLRGGDPTQTTGAEIVTRINNAAGFKFVSLVVFNALLQFVSSTSGPSSKITFYPASISGADASAIVLGLDPLSLPLSFPKFPYAFQLGDPYIVSIPKLQNKIHDELATIVFKENVDYTIDFGTGLISFAVAPPATLWGKNNFVNRETPYNNYGYLLDIYDKNTEAYLKAVKGLWFAFWTGPRPENIRRSLYLLFGLPAASQAGTVTLVSSTAVTIKYVDGTTETFTVPTDLVPTVAPGQQVTQFAPLVSGITVLDKINSPGFLEREVGRTGVQAFLTQHASKGEDPSTDESKALKTVEQNSYLPQIDVNAFISPDIKLSNVKTFLNNIQPKSRTFLLQILVGIFRDQIDLEEFVKQDISFDITPNIDYNLNIDAQHSDLVDAETNDATGIILDSEGFSAADFVDIDVYWGATLVDSFSLSG